jgi:hypothetical protein
LNGSRIATGPTNTSLSRHSLSQSLHPSSFAGMELFQS